VKDSVKKNIPKIPKAHKYILEHKDIPARERERESDVGLEPVPYAARPRAGGGRPRVVPVQIPLVCTVYAIISHKKFTAL